MSERLPPLSSESEIVEKLKAAYVALNAGDIAAALVHADDDLVIHRAGPDPPVQGKEAVAAFAAPDALAERVLEPLEFRENGDLVFVWLMVRARGVSSGIHVEQPVAHVWEMHEGRSTSLSIYTNRAAALDAVGLSE